MLTPVKLEPNCSKDWFNHELVEISQEFRPEQVMFEMLEMLLLIVEDELFKKYLIRKLKIIELSIKQKLLSVAILCTQTQHNK